MVALAVRAADAVVRIEGDQDTRALLGASEAELTAEGAKPNSATLYQVAEVHFALGDVAKAKEWGSKAVEAAANPQQKEAMEGAVQKKQGSRREERQQIR
jgi:hypothetical protein